MKDLEFHSRLEPEIDFRRVRIKCIIIRKGEAMKADVRRKNYYLDQRKIRRAKEILGAKTEAEASAAALDLVVFKREILRSLEKVAEKGGVEKVF